MDAFKNYSITSPTLQSQVDEFEAKMISFANANPDVATFFTKLNESGLLEQYSSLISRVAMASMGTADEDGKVKTDYSDEPSAPVISVAEFVNQYREAYNAVRASGYRKRAEGVYEEIFAVADRTDDMIEAQIILEKERLLWKIVAFDSLDIFEPVLEAMDPLNKATTVVVQSQTDIYKKVSCEEELLYLLEKQEFDNHIVVQHSISRMTIVATLALHLTQYSSSKIAVYESRNDTAAKGALQGMIELRFAIRRTLKFLKEEWDMTFDDILGDEGTKIAMLSPENADMFGRIKTSLNPQNFAVFKDIIDNEIIPDISVTDILLRQPSFMQWYDLDRLHKSGYETTAQNKAAKSNSELTYYIYMDKLKNSAQKLMPDIMKKQR